MLCYVTTVGGYFRRTAIAECVIFLARTPFSGCLRKGTQSSDAQSEKYEKI